MVDQPEYGTNTNYVRDFIEIRFKPQLVNYQEIRNLFEIERLSVKQIAMKLGVAKTFVLKHLKRLNVKTEVGKSRMTNPNNFRHHNPPYGYTVREGKLVVSRNELRVCRMVVELLGRQKKSARESARILVDKNIKNRRGEIKWVHLVVQQILK